MKEFVPRQSSSGRRVPGIEGLRALAAAGVVVFHAYYCRAGLGGGLSGLLLRDCALGVTLFFTLSGYLLFRPYVRAALCGTSTPRAGNYLRNRVLRILPAYWTVLGACALTFGVYETVGPALVPQLSTMPPLGHLVRSAFLVQNYSPSTFGTGLPQAWSLAVEAVFYLVLPAVGYGAIVLARRVGSAWKRRIVVLAVPVALLCLGLAVKLTIGSTGGSGVVQGSRWWTAEIYARSFLGQADQFSFGMVVAILDVLVSSGQMRLPRWWPRAAAAVIAALAVPVLTLGSGALAASPLNTLAALAAACLLALVVLPSGVQPRLRRVLEHRAFVVGGLLSYSIFLWNCCIAMWLAVHAAHISAITGIPVRYLSGVRGVPLEFAMIAVPTLVLSWVTYRLVELPALTLKRGRAGRARACPRPRRRRTRSRPPSSLRSRSDQSLNPPRSRSGSLSEDPERHRQGGPFVAANEGTARRRYRPGLSDSRPRMAAKRNR